QMPNVQEIPPHHRKCPTTPRHSQSTHISPKIANRIRALFGTDNRLNAVYGSQNLADAAFDLELFETLPFPVTKLPMIDPESTPVTTSQSTLAIIKPDVIGAGKVDEIIERIVCAGFSVAKREEIGLTPDVVAEVWGDDPELI